MRRNHTGIIVLCLLAAALIVLIGVNRYSEESGSDVAESAAFTMEKEQATETASLHFRNSSLLEQHYEKHGKEMGFATANEYEKAAASVVTNPEALHKTEAEDGDDVYYVERTNEFVIVSTDGYIRTYFYPNAGIDYYNRQ